MSDVDEAVEIKSMDQIIALIPDDQRDKVKDSVVSYIDSISKKDMDSEDFRKFVNNSENESVVNSIFDSRVSLATKTFEENFKKKKLPELIEAEVRRKYPEKTQQEIENAELKDQLNRLELDIQRKEQVNIALQKMDGLPEGIDPNNFIGETDEETTANIDKFKDILIAWRDAAVKAKDDEWLSKTADNPKIGDGADITVSYEKATMDQRNAYFNKYGEAKFNAWAKSK